MSWLKVGIAQIDTRVGDLRGNTGRILDAAAFAAEQGADVVVCPEMAVPGYPPRDLLYDDGFVAAVEEANRWLAHELRHGPTVIVGTVQRSHPSLHNVAAVLRAGRVDEVRAKRLLPSYDVFHETRWFVPGEPLPPIHVGDVPVGLLLCEDMWDEGYSAHPAADLAAAGAQLLICLSSSPFRIGVGQRRLHHARRTGLPLVYVNAVGAQDELIFDGRSFVLDAGGRVRRMLPAFEESVQVLTLGDDGCEPNDNEFSEDPATVYRALVLGVRDFARKNGLRRAFVGLSGGVDSALVACIACDALGPSSVTGVAIPSRYNDPRSLTEARRLATHVGMSFEEVPLQPMHAAAEQTLAPLLGDPTTAENVQARLRAMILMAYVNRHGGFLLNTSNKTELSLGYGTLYGDMAGTLGVLADVTKPLVYAMARQLPAIPRFILQRAPSAELRPDQTDPFDYDTVAPAVEAVVQGAPLSSLPPDLARRYASAEHKRWQMGIPLKVTERAFGSGRLYPVTHTAIGNFLATKERAGWC